MVSVSLIFSNSGSAASVSNRLHAKPFTGASGVEFALLFLVPGGGVT